MDTALSVSIIGDGPLLEECQTRAHALQHISVDVLTAISYGPAFFNFIRAHHFAVLPCIVDEQPRIILDFCAQAMPVIASDIPGLASFFQDEHRAWTFPAEDVDALAKKIDITAQSPQCFEEVGLKNLMQVGHYTHDNMHRARNELIKSAIQSSVETSERTAS